MFTVCTVHGFIHFLARPPPKVNRKVTKIQNQCSRLLLEQGKIYVTWAEVAHRNLDGVERYLAETWNPLVGERFPDVDSIAVNSPWG